MKPKNEKTTKKINQDKLSLAFDSWLQDYRSDAWTDLTSEERLVLSDYHFNKFVKEIENI